MSWISDVRHELSSLDISQKSLRKFGLMIGLILTLIGVIISIKTVSNAFISALILAGTFLMIIGIFKPLMLNLIYKIWMGFAFGIGWIISRVILTLLFYLLITPIGIISKLYGKSFLHTNFKTSSKSIWVKKEKPNSNINKMY